jgi:putative transposase
MRFPLIEAGTEEVPVPRLGKGLGVSPSGSFAGQSRPASRRQREDLVRLAPVRSAFALSKGTSGSRAGRASCRTPACRTPASPEAAVGRPG